MVPFYLCALLRSSPFIVIVARMLHAMQYNICGFRFNLQQKKKRTNKTGIYLVSMFRMESGKITEHNVEDEKSIGKQNKRNTRQPKEVDLSPNMRMQCKCFATAQMYCNEWEVFWIMNDVSNNGIQVNRVTEQKITFYTSNNHLEGG